MTTGQFEEIAHSGGKITVALDAERGYQLSFHHSRPVPFALISIYALAQGVPVRQVNLGGLGSQSEPPPFAGCYLVMICSDSQGKFGHHCPTCDGYWRSGPWPSLCPYCRHLNDPVQFLSQAQRRYVARYCDALNQALYSGRDREFTIDMDAVADAVGKDGEKPPFYVSEESQQHKFECAACGEFNDVLGRFAYCSACGTRNDALLFEGAITALRARVPVDNPGTIVRDAIAAFDNTVGQHTKQLLHLVPLSKARAERLKRGRFHDLDEIANVLSWFDIDVLDGLASSRRDFLKKMFLRRHVYEHNGGEIDEVYLNKSGDTTVRLKQHISETVPDLHQLLGDLERIARLLHTGFHELLPPVDQPIKAHEEMLARRKAVHESTRR